MIALSNRALGCPPISKLLTFKFDHQRFRKLAVSDLRLCKCCFPTSSDHFPLASFAFLLANRSLKTETLNLRVSVEFKRRLIEEATKEKGSVTNYIEATITELWCQKARRPIRQKTGKEE